MVTSYSQLKQDIWVLNKTSNRQGGYFVEAGASDGISLSNTYLLEKEYGWSGICCEPNPKYLKQLSRNRSCKIDNRLLYDTNNEKYTFYAAGHVGGTEQDFQQESKRINRRLRARKVTATSVTLNGLLEQHEAPSDIDYISLDTEGSELRILKHFDFKRWNVQIFSIEHNTQHRDDGESYLSSLNHLLSGHGYQMKINQWDAFFYR